MLEKILIIILLNLLFFSKSLCYKYSSDDIPVFQNPPKTNNIWHKILFWIEGRYRSGPQIDHFLTMLIHTTVGVFIYTGFGHDEISFMASLLFSFNPINNQASVWISGRSYAMAALGMTGAMTLPLISPLFLLLATYYNPGFLAPLAFAGSSYTWFLLFLPILWFFHWKRFSRNVKHKMDHEMYKEDKEFKIEKIILMIKTFGFYTTLSLIPFKNTFYHSFLQSAAGSGKEKAYSINDKFFWIGLGLSISIIFYWILVPWNMVSFGLLWWCIGLAPFCNLFRLSQEIAERYCYAPLPGLMIVLASVLYGHPVIFSSFMAMYATKLFFLMDQYTDDYYLLETACLNSPQSWFAWHVRGMKRWDNQSYQEAVIIWTMARMLSPKEYKINFNIATALKMSGHHEEADKYIKIAEENIPGGQEEQSQKLISEWRNGKLGILL